MPEPERPSGALSVRDAQQAVDDWITRHGIRYFHELTNFAQLVEEVGELGRLLSRTAGEQSFKPGREPADLPAALADEMADVLFVLICIANQTGVDLNDALLDNLAKKTGRDLRRHRQNDKLKQDPSLDRSDSGHRPFEA